MCTDQKIVSLYSLASFHLSIRNGAKNILTLHHVCAHAAMDITREFNTFCGIQGWSRFRTTVSVQFPSPSDMKDMAYPAYHPCQSADVILVARFARPFLLLVNQVSTRGTFSILWYIHCLSHRSDMRMFQLLVTWLKFWLNSKRIMLTLVPLLNLWGGWNEIPDKVHATSDKHQTAK